MVNQTTSFLNVPAMKKYLSFAFLILTNNIFCQSEEADIKATVNNFFLAMKNVDTALLHLTLNDSALFQTIVADKDGKVEVKNESVKEFADFITASKQGDVDERIEFSGIHYDSLLAVVWAPYKFYYKGKFSHCGNDSFQLVNTGGKWKIQYIIDTRRKDGCDNN